MGRVVSGIALWMALSGCASKVKLQVPAAPSVQLVEQRIAIVAMGECRDISDALAGALSSIDGMRVDPQADTRLVVLACNTAFHDQQGELRGRAVAYASLSDGDRVRANLIGLADRTERDGRMSRRFQAHLVEQVADDLAEQVVPVSTVVHRRVYGNAAKDSARHLHNLAVAAESEGRLSDALHLARKAWERRPSVRSARYVSDLTRRVSRIDPEALAARD